MGGKQSLPKGYTKSQINQFRETFKKYDKDGNKVLDHDEMSLYLHEIGMPPLQHRMLMYIADRNGDGGVAFNEFVKFIDSINNLKTPDDLTHLVFNAIDSDHSGTISRKELDKFYQFMEIPPSDKIPPDLQKFDYDEFSVLIDY
ncbi:Calmodulin-like protein [Histomonas meleagridis]|uniref:Calmodulin-like protein n=1 Tax=Histomonas meleagridis TaxID=135588 RepID=UPI00355A9C20|nr:Calmodulin-like protein [Histomonas meleagridis]KAH0806423.1 Calmodulin-like protein [Histomonas meleagridis]